MHKLITFSFFLYILLCPFYIFENGLPQPADIILAIGSILMFFYINKRIFLVSPIKNLIFFLILLIIINAFNQLDLNNNYIEGNTYLTSAYYIFNFLVFTLVFFIEFNKNKLINGIGILILISLTTQCILSLLGFGNHTGRALLYFNNPNQLGYYTLCLFSLYAVIPSKARKSKLLLIFTIIISSYLILISESRAALVGVGLLTIIIIYKEGFKIKLSSFIFLTIIVLSSFAFLAYSELLNEKIHSIKIRNESKTASFDEELKVRGYDRIFLYPEYLMFGAGEGGEKRFNKSYNQNEIHSGFGTIFFSYGILGFLLFVAFIYKVLKPDLWHNLIIISPTIAYNIVHQGFRESLFWILLAFIYLTSKNNVQD